MTALVDILDEDEFLQCMLSEIYFEKLYNENDLGIHWLRTNIHWFHKYIDWIECKCQYLNKQYGTISTFISISVNIRDFIKNSTSILSEGRIIRSIEISNMETGANLTITDVDGLIQILRPFSAR